jgi:hypothetical protein
MCKNEFFQSSMTKNELFKVQGQKTKLMYSLGTKTVVQPKKKKNFSFNYLSSLFIK